MHIELTDKAEADALLGLLDIAVKAGGLNAAGPALHFANKVQAAVQAEATAQSKTLKDE